MILWFAALSTFIVWAVFRSPAIDYRMVALGAVLPVTEVPFGAGPLHTMLAALIVLAAVMVATIGRRLARRRWLGLPIGMMLHLVLDGVWTRPALFWWPLGGLSGMWAEATPEVSRGILSVSMEMIGLAVGVWLLGRWGVLDDPARRTTFLRTGHLARDAVRRPEGEPDRGC